MINASDAQLDAESTPSADELDFDAQFGADPSEEMWAAASTQRAAQETSIPSTSLYAIPTAAHATLDLPASARLSEMEWANIQREGRNISELERSTDARSTVVDDSLFDDAVDESDEVDESEELEKESDEDQAKTGVLYEYLKTEHAKILKEIDMKKRPQNYIDGTYWRRPRDSVFALEDSLLKTGSVSPNPLYLLDIFVWLPHLLPGAPDIFRCECGGHLNQHSTCSILLLNLFPQLLLGYNDDPIARRVKGLHREFFLFTRRLLCNKRRKAGPGCGKSFQGTDAWILSQLPRYLQNDFPGKNIENYHTSSKPY